MKNLKEQFDNICLDIWGKTLKEDAEQFKKQKWKWYHIAIILVAILGCTILMELGV